MTVNVYAVPAVKPETVTGEDAPVPVIPPGLDVAVYPVMPDPVYVGAVNATDADKAPAVAVPIVGAPASAGQLPEATPCINCCSVHTPDADEVLVVGGVAEITAPL